VFRYLLVQYGITQLDLVSATVPIKIGDVIILPEGSFSQAEAGEDEWDYEGPEPEKRCVSHGFAGRWRHEGWDR